MKKSKTILTQSQEMLVDSVIQELGARALHYKKCPLTWEEAFELVTPHEQRALARDAVSILKVSSSETIEINVKHPTGIYPSVKVFISAPREMLFFYFRSHSKLRDTYGTEEQELRFHEWLVWRINQEEKWNEVKNVFKFLCTFSKRELSLALYLWPPLRMLLEQVNANYGGIVLPEFALPKHMPYLDQDFVAALKESKRTITKALVLTPVPSNQLFKRNEIRMDLISYPKPVRAWSRTPKPNYDANIMAED